MAVTDPNPAASSASPPGATTVYLLSIDTPELIAWYRRRGYLPTGETKPFPFGEDRVGIPRRSDLHFVVLAKPLTSC